MWLCLLRIAASVQQPGFKSNSVPSVILGAWFEEKHLIADLFSPLLQKHIKGVLLSGKTPEVLATNIWNDSEWLFRIMGILVGNSERENEAFSTQRN